MARSRDVVSPVLERLEWHEWDEVERIVKQNRILAKSTILLAELIIRLHALCFEVDPCPKYAKDDSHNSREVLVEEGPAEWQFTNFRREYNPTVLLTFPQKELENGNQAPADGYSQDQNWCA